MTALRLRTISAASIDLDVSLFCAANPSSANLAVKREDLSRNQVRIL